jgi:hypothetical protein
MDVKLYGSILREYSEQFRQLATDLSEKLETLTQAIDARQGPSEPNPACPLEGIAELNNSLVAAADIFHQRLHMFLADIKADAVSP